MALDVSRRTFLKLAGGVGAFAIPVKDPPARNGQVILVFDPRNELASNAAVKRAGKRLGKELALKGIDLEVSHSLQNVDRVAAFIVLAESGSDLARGFEQSDSLIEPEGLRMTPGQVANVPGILISAGGKSGYIYALLELAERVQFGGDALNALHLAKGLEERPSNETRGVSRYFCSELEDKSWFYDPGFWEGYLDQLISNRFNRFTLAFGLEYDFPRNVTDDYLHFAYPYLVRVPTYPEVHVLQLAAADGTRLETPSPLSEAEIAKNLEMLRFIASETAARGLQFHLGIWTHGYQWTDSPMAYHRIEGLTPENHSKFCRDALAIILRECPEIQGITMRVHGESGIPEGSYDFWQTVFESIGNAGRTVEIDMHAKGVDERIIDIAVGTGMPVKLGAKYSAEHQSLGYQQADIRALEIPHSAMSQSDEALFRFSSGSRSFTRYGYADFLKEKARYKLWFRLWPGTQRHLLSGDPEMAAAYGRTASFCGAVGLDLMEPLTFEGREGSGQLGGRCAYLDSSLNPSFDWQKYDIYYRIWGRKLYNPDADMETWQRTLRQDLGASAMAAGKSLAYASRILPLLTSAHLPSASNHDLWYEMPVNMPIVEGSEPSPYGDTPNPKVFGTVSPLDPEMFSTVIEYVHSSKDGRETEKYSPLEIAKWLYECSENAAHWLETAKHSAKSAASSVFRRLEEDVLIQVGLGQFFAHKLRSSVSYETFRQSSDQSMGLSALDHYQKARDAWRVLADRAKGVYRSNVPYGSVAKRRGHWTDRLQAIDADLAAMTSKVHLGPAKLMSAGKATRKSDEFIDRLQSFNPTQLGHVVPDAFVPGRPLTLKLLASHGNQIRAVQLRYRHVNQAERWKQYQAVRGDNGFSSEVPQEYTKNEHALEYYFVITEANGIEHLHPGFNGTFSNQPYYTVSKRSV